jgi:CRISPR-associated protein Cmr6
MKAIDLRRADGVLARVREHEDINSFPGRLRSLGLVRGLEYQNKKDEVRPTRLAAAFVDQLGLGDSVPAAVLAMNSAPRARLLTLHREAFELAQALHLRVRSGPPGAVQEVLRRELGRDPVSRVALPAEPIAHVGLGMDKFAPVTQKGEAKATYIHGLVEKKVPEAYRAVFERWARATPPGPKGRRVLRLSARARLLCGLGAPSPTENGLSLHPVFGTPWIPGSSLKGITRSWTAATRGHDPAWAVDGEAFRTLFGATPDREEAEAGAVDFLDAWWVPDGQSPWVPEVVTPHQRGYYEQRRLRTDGHPPPDGMDDPVPNTFLAARGSYRLVLEGPDAWLTLAEALLIEALRERGVGAKTRAGYGRLEPDGECAVDARARAEHERRERERRAAGERQESERRAAELGARLRQMDSPAAQLGLCLEQLDQPEQRLSDWLRSAGQAEISGLPLEQPQVERVADHLREKGLSKGLSSAPEPVGAWVRALWERKEVEEKRRAEEARPSRPLQPGELEQLIQKHSRKKEVDHNALCRELGLRKLPAEQLDFVRTELGARGAKAGHLKHLEVPK